MNRWGRETLAALAVFVGWLVISVIGGVVWGFLAPAEHLVVFEPGRMQTIAGESGHYFDSVAIFAAISLVVAIVGSAATWRWRSMRGPILFAGLFLGALDGAREMMFTGELVARLRFPEIVEPAVGEVVAVAPTIDTLLVLIIAPLIACLSVLVMAAINPRDDLGVEGDDRNDVGPPFATQGAAPAFAAPQPSVDSSASPQDG
ncbi:DUF2567 domain-containing protein [Antrihabitans sp. YC2-6]|uniref:DUF2567 domain-containing protein n=1 Tax=Antrihabitans sp. YC2-6 TaxID=2799498 RepID=UPI0018F7567E|nr:DUF2567 domain-containing protein [Antrihabitans sp. YC2-6]MBJ8343165.1 DUF2567 domain-containing protein [Antrihabitans sp. YC2-6]